MNLIIVDELHSIHYMEHNKATIISGRQVWAGSHIASCVSIIAFSYRSKVHFNRCRLSCTWKLNSNILWNRNQVNQRQFSKQSHTQKNNLQSTKYSQFLSSPCSQLLLWDPLVRPMHASIKRWYKGHRDFFPFDTTTIHFGLVWIFLVNHFGSFICAIRPIYTTF